MILLLLLSDLSTFSTTDCFNLSASSHQCCSGKKHFCSLFKKSFSHFFQDSYSAPVSPTPPTQPPELAPSSPETAAPTPGKPGASGAQHRAQALRLGGLIAELEKMLQNLNQSCSEKELKALDNKISHLSIILKVPVCIYAHAHA